MLDVARSALQAVDIEAEARALESLSLGPVGGGYSAKKNEMVGLGYTRLEAITGLAESARQTGQYDVQAAINYVEEQRGIRVANNIPPEKECPVCLQNPRNAVFRCGHRVCYECALKLHIFDKCPTCRQDVNRWEVIKIFD